MATTSTRQRLRAHVHELRHDLTRVAVVTNRLRRELSFKEFRSGQWFERAVRLFLAHHAAHKKQLAQQGEHATTDELSEACAAQAERVIRRASIEAAALGLVSAAITTEGSLLTAETEGLAGVVALPVAAAAVVSDMLLRSMLHLGMACDLGDAYGTPFKERTAPELMSLCALALLGEGSHHDDQLGRESLSRIADADAELAGKAIGSQLFGETLSRDAVPFLSLVTSTWTSYVVTRQLGRFLQNYVVHRRALVRVIRPLFERRPEAEELLLEGLWFIYTADGRLTREETAVLGGLLALRGERADNDELFERFVTDEASWLARLRDFAPDDAPARNQLLSALKLAAALSRIAPSARSLLESAAQSLGSSLGSGELEQLNHQADRGMVPAFA